MEIFTFKMKIDHHWTLEHTHFTVWNFSLGVTTGGH